MTVDVESAPQSASAIPQVDTSVTRRSPTAESSAASSAPSRGAAPMASAAQSSLDPFSPQGAIAGRGTGEALPSSFGAHLGASYGADTSSVRVHTDSRSAQAADSAGAEAFTYGNDIFFGSGRYNPSDAHGAFVLAHEVAHVAQQGSSVQAHAAEPAAQAAIETGSESDPAEAEASLAAHAALAGQRFTVSPTAGRIRFFKQANGDPSQGGHAHMTETALRSMGMSNTATDPMGVSDVRAARQGNWERDLSQAILPSTRGILDTIMDVLNILSIKDFGRGLRLQEFGGYDPVEHIDNPADLRASGAFAQGAMPQVGDMDADQHHTEAALSGAESDNASAPGGQYVAPGAAPPPAGAHFERRHVPGLLGGSDENFVVRDDNGAQLIDPHSGQPLTVAAYEDSRAYADVDQRYAGTQLHGQIMNPTDAAAYQVDESGIPRYVQTSRGLLKVQLKNAMRLGRDGNDGRGGRLFSSAVHILQDYYAHSNFAEIALNILLRERGPDGQRTGLSVRGADGQMQTISADTYGSVLNSQMHANRVGPDGQVTTDPANLEFNGREVLTTGTFNLTDTVASVLEEVQDRWKQFNPFMRNSKEPSALIGACLDYMEMDPEAPGKFSGLGATIGNLVRNGVSAVEAIAPVAANVVEGAGNVAGGATRIAGSVASGGLGLLGSINGFLGGDSDYFADNQRSVTTSTSAAATSVESSTGEAAQRIRDVAAQLAQLGTTFADGAAQQQHLARRAYVWVNENVTPIEWIAQAAERIQVYGPQIAAAIRTTGNQIKIAMETVLGAAWNKVIDRGVERINGVISTFRAKTNMANQRDSGRSGQMAGPTWLPNAVRSWAGEQRAGMQRTFGGVGDMYENGQPTNGIAPGTYTPPSHTEVAKDHGDLSQGARDGEQDGAFDPQSQQEAEDHEHGHSDGTSGGTSHEHAGEEGDQHGHVHQGAWLSPIAEGMGMAATRAVGDHVSRGWDQIAALGGNPAPGYPHTHDPSLAAFDNAIDHEVDVWFAHPADTRASWEGFVRSQVATARVSTELLRRLSNAAPSNPQQPDAVDGPSPSRAPNAPAGGLEVGVEGPHTDIHDTRPGIYGVTSRLDPHAAGNAVAHAGEADHDHAGESVGADHIAAPAPATPIRGNVPTPRRAARPRAPVAPVPRPAPEPAHEVVAELGHDVAADPGHDIINEHQDAVARRPSDELEPNPYGEAPAEHAIELEPNPYGEAPVAAHELEHIDNGFMADEMGSFDLEESEGALGQPTRRRPGTAHFQRPRR